MTEAKIKLALEGVQTVMGGLKQVGDRIGQVSASVAGLTAIGGGLSIAAFASIVKDSTEAAGALHDLSIQTGASVESLSGLASVGKYSDVSVQQISGSMNKLARNMSGATEESKGAGKALEALGINFSTFKNLSPDQQMRTIADSMNTFEDGSGKAAVAMALLGKEGAQMLPFMKDLAETAELQAKITTEQAAAADNFGDNLTKLKGSGEAWKKELAMGMVPALNTGLQAFLDVTNGTGGLRDEVRKLSADGSIARWTQNAITGATYVMDAFAGVKRVIVSVGNVIGAYAAGVVSAFQSVAEIGAHLIKGDFSGAADAVGAHITRLKSIVSDLGSTLDETWSEETLGQKLRSRIADMAAAGTVAEGVKKKLDFTNINGKEAKGTVSDYDKLVASIREKISVQNLELTIDEKATDGQKLLAKVNADLASGTVKLKDDEEQYVKALLEGLIATEHGVAIKREMAKAASDLIAVGAKNLKAIDDELAKQREHNAEIGLTKDQIAALVAEKIDLEAASDRETAAAMRAAAQYAGPLHDAYLQYAADLERAAAAKNDLATVKRDGAAKQILADDAEEATKEWKKFNDSIYQGLTDSLYRGFEAGKGFFKSFWDGIRNFFKTTVLKLAIQGVMTGVIGGTGVASAATIGGAAGGAGALGSAGSIMSGVGAIAGNFGSGISAGFSQLTAGVNPLAALSSVADVGAASLSTALGQVAGYLGPIVAAAAIVAKGLSYKTVGSGVLGTVSGDEFSGNAYEYKKGGFLRGGGKTQASELGKDMDKAFSDAITGMYDNFSSLGTAVGAGSDLLKGFNYQFRLALRDFDEAGKQKEIGRALSAMSDSMAMAFVDSFRTSVDTAVQAANRYWTNTIDGEADRPNGPSNVIVQDRPTTALDPYIDDIIRIFDAQRESLQGVQGAEGKLSAFVTQIFSLGNALAENAGYVRVFGDAIDFQKLETAAERAETVVDTFNRLNTVFTATNSLAESLGQNVEMAFGAVGLSSVAARQRVIDLVGGVDTLAAGSASFAQNFLAESERLAPIIQQVDEALGKFGWSGIRTKEQLVAFAKSLDLTSEAGAKALAALLGIQGGYLEIANNAASAGQSQADAFVKAREDLASAYERESGAMRSTLDKMKDFSRSLLTGNLSPLTNKQKYEEAARQYADAVVKKASGNQDAINKFPEIAQQFLEISRVYNASGSGYQNDFAAVAAETQRTADSVQTQLSMMDRQVSGLITINSSVTQGSMSVVAAINNLTAVTAANGPAGQINNLYRSLLNRDAESTGLSYYLQQMSGGASIDSVRQNILNSQEYLSKLPKLDVGTNSMPADMPIMAHKFERIIPPADNRELMARLRNPSENSAALAAELKELREEFRQYRQQQASETSALIQSNMAAHQESSSRIAGAVVDGGSKSAYSRRLADEARVK